MHQASPRRALFGAAAAVTLAAAASAQQFQYQVGLIPGTPRWTEGLEAADVDNDGDLDLFFAEGDGFASAGTQRQNILQINKTVETGSLSFADESVARLGVNLSNAKGVTTGDIDADGWMDALFANAFNTDTPFLYHNRGMAQPGFFDQQATARGLGSVYSSAGAQFGDIDDDGDLDLVICDSGASFFGGAGGRPHLFHNDGTGNFTEASTADWNPPLKKAHMDVQLVDIDGDWDLDFFGVNRANNSGGTHYLMLNQGDGSFIDSSTTIPATSSSVYEAELGDLDDDTDIDVFWVSLTGFQEGAHRNDIVPTGTLGFTSQGGLGVNQDDNEILLLDFDTDGDLDPFVGSLGSRERIWRNNGGFNFASADPAIQAVVDSTLDMTAADLDNDGDYDVITAQGESNPGQYVSKVYVNGGSADDRAPIVVAENPVAELDTTTGPWVAHAKIRDQVIDDGVNYVSASANFLVKPFRQVFQLTITAGGFLPIVVQAGTRVNWVNGSGANQSVTSTTAPYDYDSGTLANGETYSRVFVTPGVYNYTSLPSGFNGMVTVNGTVSTVSGTYMRGNQYRFAMSGDASSPTAQLAYECFFEDYAGNVSVSTASTAERPMQVGTPVCFGDGTGAPCGCTNGVPNGTQTGCGNSTGVGGWLTAHGDPSLGADTLTLNGSQLPDQPGLYFQGDNTIAGGAGTGFGDGLRCCGSAVVRIQTATASGGASSTTDTISAEGGQNLSPGDTKCYQLWYRDPAGPCGSGFNLTNALEITWTL